LEGHIKPKEVTSILSKPVPNTMICNYSHDFCNYFWDVGVLAAVYKDAWIGNLRLLVQF
jgi:hypothetical protein